MYKWALAFAICFVLYLFHSSVEKLDKTYFTLLMHKWALVCCYMWRSPCYHSRCLCEGNFPPQMWRLQRLVGKWWALQVDWIYPRRLSIFVVDFPSSELKKLRWISIMSNRWSGEVREISAHAGIKSNLKKIARDNKVFVYLNLVGALLLSDFFLQ